MINSIEKYRLFDLTLLSILAVICEVIGELLHITLPGAGFYLSFSILVALIAMIRWGKWGAIVYIIAGIPMIFLYHGNIVENIVLYPMSYMFIVIASLLFKALDRDKIKENIFYLLCFTVSAYLCVSVGKGVGMFLLTGEFLKGTAYYFLTQLFNMIMVFVVLLILKHRKGLLVNMNTYLSNIDSDKQK